MQYMHDFCSGQVCGKVYMERPWKDHEVLATLLLVSMRACPFRARNFCFGHVCVGDCLSCCDVVFKGACLLRQCLCAASVATSLQGRVILISCTPTTFLFHGLCNTSVVFFVTCYTWIMNLLFEMCMLLRLTSVRICCLKCACF